MPAITELTANAAKKSALCMFVDVILVMVMLDGGMFDRPRSDHESDRRDAVSAREGQSRRRNPLAPPIGITRPHVAGSRSEDRRHSREVTSDTVTSSEPAAIQSQSTNGRHSSKTPDRLVDRAALSSVTDDVP
jgi:hypothetical protein